MTHSRFHISRLRRFGPALLLVVLIAIAVQTALSGVSLSGKIDSLRSGATIELLRQDLDDRTSASVASITVDQSGSFSATFDDLEPGLFSLLLPDSRKIDLAIGPSQSISIEADGTRSGGLAVAGSPDTRKLREYEAFRKESLARLVYPPRSDLRQAQKEGASPEKLEELAQREVDAYDAHRRELNDFVLDEIGPSIALYATSTRWDGDYRRNELQELVDAFAAQYPSLAITRSMQQRMEQIARTAIGAQGADLTGTTLDGETLSLSDLRGRVVLLDFWASWCAPCRVENRHYVKLYNEYADQNFEILGVNLDDDRARWESASRRDRISWPQISDSLGWNSPLADAYNVTALPMSFLLDEEGRIIARNLRGPQLAAKLSQVLAP